MKYEIRLYRVAIVILIVAFIFLSIVSVRVAMERNYNSDMVDFKQSVIDSIRLNTGITINSIYELDLRNEIVLNNQAINYLQEIDNY